MYADSHCKEFVEHIAQEAREQMADAISRGWSHKVDLEMQDKIHLEHQVRRLEQERDERAGEQSHILRDNRHVYVVSTVQTVKQPLGDLMLDVAKLRNAQFEDLDARDWPREFEQVQVLRAVRQVETTGQKDDRIRTDKDKSRKGRLEWWAIEFQAKLRNDVEGSIKEKCGAAHQFMADTRWTGLNDVWLEERVRKEIKFEREANGSIKMPEFAREDIYQPVAEHAQINTHKGAVVRADADPWALKFEVQSYHWKKGLAPTRALKGQPQPVENLIMNYPENLRATKKFRVCKVGPSEPDTSADGTEHRTTDTNRVRRIAHTAREVQGGYADLVCLSSMVMCFLQGATDFVTAMAPMLIVYEAYGEGTDAETGNATGGLDWELQCPADRFGAQYGDFLGAQFATDVSDLASGGRRSLQGLTQRALSTCPETQTCALRNDFSVGGGAVFFGACFLGIGALLGGHRTLNRFSFELVTSCSPADGFCATTAAMLVWCVCLWLGLPISLTHLTIGAMIGMATGIGKYRSPLSLSRSPRRARGRAAAAATATTTYQPGHP